MMIQPLPEAREDIESRPSQMVDFEVDTSGLIRYRYEEEQGPDCICSRCQFAIMGPEIGIRLLKVGQADQGEYRLHATCFNQISGSDLCGLWVNIFYME